MARTKADKYKNRRPGALQTPTRPSKHAYLQCPACRQRVRPNEPHLVVEDLTTGAKWYYHTGKPRCEDVAFRRVTYDKTNGPYRIHRHEKKGAVHGRNERSV